MHDAVRREDTSSNQMSQDFGKLYIFFNRKWLQSFPLRKLILVQPEFLLKISSGSGLWGFCFWNVSYRISKDLQKFIWCPVPRSCASLNSRISYSSSGLRFQLIQTESISIKSTAKAKAQTIITGRNYQP